VFGLFGPFYIGIFSGAQQVAMGLKKEIPFILHF